VVEQAHDAGLLVNAWTINTAQQWRSAVRSKIDGIITDDPEGLRAFLKRVPGSTCNS
jgi:glycerophosphoryl diester phosphodiesterase